MLITRETDYALRILQSLLNGEKKSVGEISEQELIPQQFAYKIIKKLSQAGFVQILRGADGGCRLACDLDKVSLFDLMAVTESHYAVNACMDPAYHCPRREKKGRCIIHSRLVGVQQRLDEELRSYNLKSLLKPE